MRVPLTVLTTITAGALSLPAVASASACLGCVGAQHFTESADTGGAGSAYSQTFAEPSQLGGAGSHQQQVFTSSGPCPVPDAVDHGSQC